MRSNNYKSVLKHAGLAATVLLLASGAAFAQQQVNLTAAAAMASLPDGTAVHMWGYTCGAGSTGCAPLNAVAATAGAWSPGVSRVRTGQDLPVTLTTNLTVPGHR